ncbi:MAG: hypothetical protein ACRC4W_02285 [Treponemataceae bacterium]
MIKYGTFRGYFKIPFFNIGIKFAKIQSNDRNKYFNPISNKLAPFLSSMAQNVIEYKRFKVYSKEGNFFLSATYFTCGFFNIVQHVKTFDFDCNVKFIYENILCKENIANIIKEFPSISEHDEEALIRSPKEYCENKSNVCDLEKNFTHTIEEISGYFNLGMDEKLSNYGYFVKGKALIPCSLDYGIYCLDRYNDLNITNIKYN